MQKTELTNQSAPPQEENEDFYRRLDEFRDSLDETEQYILASMVVNAADGDEATAPEASAAPTTNIEPTDEEIDAFAEKLDEFHDSLPGDEHLVLDSLIVRSALKEDKADVEGYQWMWMMVVPTPTTQAFSKLCANLGGRPMRPQRLRQNRRLTAIGCVMP